MSFIIENCMVEVFPDEFFADKFTHYDITIRKFRRGVAPNIFRKVNDETTDTNVLSEALAIEPSADFGHLAPDWKFVMENGIPGIIARLEKYRAESLDNPEKTEFYDNSLCVYKSIIKLLLKFAESAGRIGTPKMQFVAENLTSLSENAPKTLAEAMQLTLIIYSLQTKLELSTVRSLGGLDRLYGRFYTEDIASGRFTEAQLRELIRDFFYKISLMKVAANMHFYICGRNSDGTDATSDFTRVLLEEYAKLDIYDPKIHVLYHKDVRPDITRFIIELIKKGKSSFVFINNDLASKALEGIGISPEDAKKVIVYGCYETASEGEEIPSTCGGRINLPKILDMFIHGGRDILKDIRTEFEPRTEYKTFDEFYTSFKDYLRHCVTVCMNTISAYEPYYKDFFTAPILSATFKSSVEKGTDIFSGGAKYNNTSIVCACQASLADSLLAVKKLVFEDKLVTMDELRAVLVSDWKENPALRERCLAYPKFANNQDEADAIFSDMSDFLADIINGHKNGRGGVYRYGNFSIDWRFRFGKATAALPDGHRSGEPLSKNFCATVGMDKNGVTSFINSVLKTNSEKIPDGCVTDVVLHSSSAAGEEGTNAILGLLTSFMNGKGFAIQFNILSSEILKLAQKTPEKYKNLQIRVCGWNANFVNLSETEQNEFITQAEQ